MEHCYPDGIVLYLEGEIVCVVWVCVYVCVSVCLSVCLSVSVSVCVFVCGFGAGVIDTWIS